MIPTVIYRVGVIESAEGQKLTVLMIFYSKINIRRSTDLQILKQLHTPNVLDYFDGNKVGAGTRIQQDCEHRGYNY